MTLEGPPHLDRADRDRDLFDRVAQRYADKDLRPAMRIARKHRALATWDAAGNPHATRLLEVGCGAGFGARYLRDRFDSYDGIDYSNELIQIAEELNGRPAVRFLVADAKSFRPPEPPDVILLIGVLHHIDDPTLALKHFFDLLAPGGILMANEPQDTNPLFRIARTVRGRIDSDYSQEQEYYNPRDFEAQARLAGFVDLRTFGQGLLTTPFAEVRLPGQAILKPLVRACALVDRALESSAQVLLRRAGWNVVLIGAKPGKPGQVDSSEAP